MSWFGNIRTFHASALNLLAGSLAKCPDLPWEKVQRLLAHCPPVGETSPPSSTPPSCVLHDRALSGVVALGLFAVESKLKLHGDRVLSYLLQLLRSLPTAKWIQNTLASAKREGLIVEQFSYKLGLILTHLAAWNPDQRTQVVQALLASLQWYCDHCVQTLHTKPEEMCYETVPALLGLSRALKGTVKSRAAAFREMCGIEGQEEGEGEGGGKELDFQADDVVKIKNMVLQLINPEHLKQLSVCAEGQQGAGLGYPYRSLAQVLHCSLITLLRDCVTACPLSLEPMFYRQLVRVCEGELEGGVRELGSGASAASNERAFNVICILTAATDMMVWASRDDTEVDSSFHRLSSLLTVHTSRFSVLVSPLRATILEGISTLASRTPALLPASLTRYKELLYSSLLARMYGDAVASGNLETALMARPMSFEQLVSYRMTSVHVSRADAFVCVHWMLGQVVCRTLQVCSEGGTEVMDGFLASLGNKLYTTDASDESQLHTAECIVMLLGQVASEMGSRFNVVATVTGMLGQRLFHPSSPLDGKIVGELGKIAACTGDRGTLEVLVRLMNQSLGETYPNKDTTKYGHIYQPMMESLTFLARYLDNMEQHRDLLLKTLQLFIQQGITAKRASDTAQSSHKATSSSFSLGLLLPVIAALAEGVETFSEPTKKEIKIFRDFWLYCVIMGFSEAVGVFPAGWYRSVQGVALKSPLLLFMGAGQYLDKELELNHPLKIDNIGQGELQEARQSLLDGLDRSPELDRLVSRLTFFQCLYLQSIYRLESLRLESSTRNFPLIFHYLEDKGLQGELWVAMEKIAHKLFDQFIEQMQAKTATQACAHELESVAQLLVFKFIHIRGRIKQLADKFLSKVVDKFSHLLWSSPVVRTMLDLLHQMSLTLHTMEPGRRRSLEITLPSLPHSVTVPEDVQKREKTVRYFAQRVEQILELAMRWSPRETTSILLEYVRAEASSAHHSGVSLATSQINKYFHLNSQNEFLPSSVSESRPSCVKDQLSLRSSSLHLRSHHTGEVAGMVAAASLITGATPGNEGEAVTKLAAVFTSQLKDALRDGSQDQLVTSLYRCTALLLHSPPPSPPPCSPPSPLSPVHRSLLYAITQLPVHTFTEVAIATAIQCWQWLLTAQPNLEFPFMRELCAVWKWSVEERHGLFSRDHTPSLGKADERREPIPTHQHNLIIQFLTDRFDVIRSRSSAQVQLISEVLHQSLTLGVGPESGQPQVLSHSPEAASPRFKLLALGVQLLREKLLTNSLERTLLREKIYNTVLDYFCYEPSWPVGDTVVVREAIATLIKFWLSVRDMKNTSVVSLSPSVLEASTTLPRSSSSFWQLAVSSQASPAQGSWMNTLGSVRVSKGVSSNLLSPNTSLHQPKTPPTASRKSSNLTKSKVLLKRKNVVLALLRNEIERLTVWQNPNSLPDLAVPKEDEVAAWLNPTQSERHWRSTIIMAFQASPHLAFHMINRFRYLEVVAREVVRLVDSDPVPFHTIPEAAQLLARRDNLQQGVGSVATEMYHLLYWRNVSPASTLIFFYKPFSQHPITAQFASKAMQSFKPDDILLYIPQLVQSLRYDKLGFARAYILTAAKKSQLLAHQFLWNMEANMFVDEEMKQRDPEIGDVLEKLADEIKASMTGSALQFYEREFSFFRKVTNISGIIRPFPKGPLRKAECLKALQEVELQPGVYLPSNPGSVVVGIDYKSGKPMQSAAKAPFLARFRVVKCGTGEVEEMNSRSVEALASLSSQLSSQGVWQASIFKVGDDVRQDMLALQIIQLFQDVFHSVGLNLFLFPYRVVATASGCGVIEVVPDSKSRDEIGKQTQASLRDYFHSVYGAEDSIPYQEARANFVRSMAAYSLVSYLLQIKDRHNGNIMVDKHGHIIHIDFGFLFESSPGGNLGFEPDLKLTEEMLEVMDGKKSDTYRWFLQLCVRGYLCLRPYREQVVSLVSLMLDTGFPCFRRNSIEELRARFRPTLSEREAAKTIIEVVEYSCLNFRTKTYDLIQDVQQNIYYHNKTD